MSANAYYRVTPTGEFLKTEDYRFGFGMDTSLYGRICRKREEYNLTHENKLPLRSDFKDDYDLREGFNIEGKPFSTRPHPILGKRIKDTETGETYIIEGIYKHHDFGYYWIILIRREGTKSHGTRFWENINCKNPTITDSIKENKETIVFI